MELKYSRINTVTDQADNTIYAVPNNGNQWVKVIKDFIPFV